MLGRRPPFWITPWGSRGLPVLRWPPHPLRPLGEPVVSAVGSAAQSNLSLLPSNLAAPWGPRRLGGWSPGDGRSEPTTCRCSRALRCWAGARGSLPSERPCGPVRAAERNMSRAACGAWHRRGAQGLWLLWPLHVGPALGCHGEPRGHPACQARPAPSPEPGSPPSTE